MTFKVLGMFQKLFRNFTSPPPVGSTRRSSSLGHIPLVMLSNKRTSHLNDLLGLGVLLYVHVHTLKKILENFKDFLFWSKIFGIKAQCMGETQAIRELQPPKIGVYVSSSSRKKLLCVKLCVFLFTV